MSHKLPEDHDRFTTATGRVLTDADLEALADEAEKGWTEPTDSQRAESGRIALSVMVKRAKKAEAELARLRHVMAAALERVQVGDCGEAEHILSLEVNLDGSPTTAKDKA